MIWQFEPTLFPICFYVDGLKCENSRTPGTDTKGLTSNSPRLSCKYLFNIRWKHLLGLIIKGITFRGNLDILIKMPRHKSSFALLFLVLILVSGVFSWRRRRRVYGKRDVPVNSKRYSIGRYSDFNLMITCPLFTHFEAKEFHTSNFVYIYSAQKNRKKITEGTSTFRLSTKLWFIPIP